MTPSMTLNQHNSYKILIITSLNSETAFQLIYRIPDLCLDIKFTRLGFENAGLDEFVQSRQTLCHALDEASNKQEAL